jgi:hypothetical protein
MVIKAQAAPKNMWMAVDPLPNMSSAPARQHQLLSQDYMWRLMESFQLAGLHFLNRKGDMKLNKFHDTMFLRYRGVKYIPCIYYETTDTFLQIVSYMST